ncbi:DUF5134 domain-containing protein [Streptomyces sp. NBC_00102]|uniref:DUF5134 domain-containing protein n=1 Tax=Streptomyces sp. NBC_00102 TaxID=2975652 RepID=UPI002250A998|nr:DUF5134 domain-containing protein [Streptomyces sp. NBC_00102]MCX5401598.1 DUF5134 domain-containing protein [Streptomyces sp. NBC_00102]
MHGPALSGWLLMVLCAATGAYCLLRAHAETGEERRAAHAEALMGFGMAAMAVPAALLTLPEGAWAAYATLFGGAALRSAWAARRGGHHLHHLVGSLAMVYMALAMAPGAGGGPHAGHGGGASGPSAGLPLLTGVLLVYYAFYVLSAAGRLIPVAGGAGTGAGAGTGVGTGVGGGSGAAAVAGGRRSRPELALACRVTMGLAMLAMLAGL